MRYPRLRIDAPWRARICFVLAGAIFVLSQFFAAAPPSGRPDVTSGHADSAVAETERADVGADLD